jgi:predicted nucleic acid-binding protein
MFTAAALAWMRFKVQEITLSILTGALEIKAAHGFSYWDSAIIAAAPALGCRILYSEDMSHGREIEGIYHYQPVPLTTRPKRSEEKNG